MPFDAITAGNMGAIMTLAKPQPPEELRGLWTMQGNLNDLSRYGNNLSSLTTYSFNTAGFGQAITDASGAIPCSIDGDFTFEWIRSATPEYYDNQGFTVLNWVFTNQYDYGNNALYYRVAGSTSRTHVDRISSYAAMMHVALVRRSTTLYVYINGVKKTTISSATGTLRNIAFDCAYQNLQNVRLVSKALGTTTTFPVPNGLYTGFEPL